MSVVWIRLAGSMTASCAWAGGATRLTIVTINRSRRNIKSSLSERVRRPRRHVCRQLDIAGEIHLHAVSLPDGDRRKPVEKPIHHLERRLRRCVADPTSDDDCSIAITAAQARASEILGEPADKADRCRRSERGQVMLVDLVAETGIADLVESQELIEPVGTAVGHQQAMEGHGKTGLTERLYRLSFTENPRA